jgi:ankyrin repeat protein
VNRRGCTALLSAAYKGHVECATALIDANADVDKADTTPLRMASVEGRVECVRVRRLGGS